MEKKLNKIFNIKKKPLLSGSDVFIIAEIGKNFIQSKSERSVSEYLKNAKKLVKFAKKAGADAVKFQTHNLDDEQLKINVVSKHFKGSDRYSWVKRNERVTPLYFWKEIKKFCDKQDILFFSTPMSRGAAEKLQKVDVPLWKVGSADILDFLMLSYLAKTGKPIIISSGMSTLREVDDAIRFLKKRTDKVILMHCVSKYPCPENELNLNTIRFFQERYKIPVGFSDHSLGYKSSVAAAGIGAVAIEKHFSLNRKYWGSDHKVSMLPKEFKKMTDLIRNGKKVIIKNYGIKGKILNKEEGDFRAIFRKSLVAGRKIKKGETLLENMIYAMRPRIFCPGLRSEEFEKIVGKKAIRNISKYEPLEKNLFD